MAVEYNWPSRLQAKTIGKRVSREDGLAKATGAAKYSYDINPRNQLIARALGCPHAHCRIKSIDTAAAEKIPGVVHVEVFEHAKPGSEIQWEGELLAVVAAESEAAAKEGVMAIRLDVEKLAVFVREDDLKGAEAAGRTKKAGGKVQTEKEPGDDEDEDEFADKEIERLLKASAHTVEGYYGIDTITHCCLEPHGSTCEWHGDKLVAHLSTQNVSGTDEQFARDLKITADDVEVHCDYVGGGFGSKFAPDYWGVAAARIAKATGRPVKFMLDRDQELKNAGSRPSGYINVRLGADKNGVLTVWDSQHWGTQGFKGGGVSHSQIPYVIRPKNYRRVQTGIACNVVQARAWRAPNHPQACAITQTAIDDLAAKMGKDSYDVFMANLEAGNFESQQEGTVYIEEMKVAAELMDWKAKYHLHGKGKANGSVVEGLGLAMHTWGGVANNSDCRLKIHPDGGVESFCGSQDLGTGTRTVIAMVVAETFGLSPDDINVNIGSSKYPASGASGGSTTVGGVSESHRRASQDALAQIFEKVAPGLKSAPEELEAAGGRIQRKANPDVSLSWKQACSALGMKPLEVSASHKRGNPSSLSSSGVGGVQMAHVAVDRETGVIKMKKFVAVQDQGLVINPKTCESQIYGAVIMGIASALFESRITDPKSGKFINAEMGEYKLARLGDIGEIVVHLYESDDQRARGVIGNGEPPVISPNAAISNAVCNALGVRVPVIPMTPKRVLKALEGKA